MGGLFSTPTSQKRRVVMLGLDAAGKTTVQMQLTGTHSSILLPTIGFNVEHLIAGPLKLQIWDIGG